MPSKRSGFELNGNIVPDGDNTRDLGSSSNAFKDFYVHSVYLQDPTEYYPLLNIRNQSDPQTAWGRGAIKWSLWNSIISDWSALFQVRCVGNTDASGNVTNSGLQFVNDATGSILFYLVNSEARFLVPVKVDEVNEYTSGSGVTVEGVQLKDNNVYPQLVAPTYQYIHQPPFYGWSVTAPGNGSATADATRLQITINDGALTDYGEIWLPIYDKNAETLVHLDDKKVKFRVRGYLELSNVGVAASEVNLAKIVLTGANVWLGFKFTIEVSGTILTNTVRLYAVNQYWDSASSSYVETATLITSWTHNSAGVPQQIPFELELDSDGSNATYKELISGTSATISVGDDNNAGSAELDVWCWRNVANCGYDIELDILQWSFAREW